MVFAEPFDLLFRNFFENDTFFQPACDKKPKYPVNIFEIKDELNPGLQFEIAVVGLDDDDIDIEIKDGDTLTISYDKPELSAEEVAVGNEIKRNWIHKGIAQRSFSLGWKIGNKFELDEISANVDKGLLTIFIPLAENKKPKKISLGKIKKPKN
jgi:HSP20 family molecular chaperone IbpA